MFANQPVLNLEWLLSHHVGNKAKGRISKRVFPEKKARQIFPKYEHFLPPNTHTLKGHTYLNKLAAESKEYLNTAKLVCVYDQSSYAKAVVKL